MEMLKNGRKQENFCSIREFRKLSKKIVNPEENKAY
jgi:hypothetical protein